MIKNFFFVLTQALRPEVFADFDGGKIKKANVTLAFLNELTWQSKKNNAPIPSSLNQLPHRRFPCYKCICLQRRRCWISPGILLRAPASRCYTLLARLSCRSSGSPCSHFRGRNI